MAAGPLPSAPKSQRWLAASLGGLFLLGVGVLSLSGRVPLTYDEAYNFTDLAAHGVGFVVTHYPNPNNHVAFTALQALLPVDAIRSWPPLLRIPNLLVGAALLVLLAHALNRDGKLRPVAATLLALSSLLAAPLFTTYLLVARGYLTGTLLLLAALAWAAEGRTPLGAAALLALATWTVPTFAYAVPGVLAVGVVAAEDRRRAAVAAALAGLAFLALVLLLYAPLLPGLLAQRQAWREFAPPGRFTLGIARRLTNVAHMGAGVVALVVAGGAALLARRQPHAFRHRLLLLALGAGASFLIMAEALAALRLATTPFWRNMLFAPLLLALALGLALPALPRAARAVVWALLLFNAALGLRDLSLSFPRGNPGDYRGFRALGPTGIERGLETGAPFWDVRCDQLAEAVCQAYVAHLPGLSIGPVERDSLPCLGGGSPPPEGAAIAVSMSEGRRQLCY